MSRQVSFRTDSLLGNLPEERQQEIAEFLMKVKKGDRYEVTRRHLEKDGLSVTRSQLVRWWHGWRSRRVFSGLRAQAEAFEQSLKAECPGMSAEQIRESGQLYFTAIAQAGEDSKEFREMEYLRLHKETAKMKAELEKAKIAISNRRVLLLEKKAEAYDRAQAALRDAKASKGGVTKETLERIERELNLL